MSIFGGDPQLDKGFRDKLLKSGFKSAGFVQFDHDGTVEEVGDITRPIAWAIGTRTTP